MQAILLVNSRSTAKTDLKMEVKEKKKTKVQNQKVGKNIGLKGNWNLYS